MMSNVRKIFLQCCQKCHLVVLMLGIIGFTACSYNPSPMVPDKLLEPESAKEISDSISQEGACRLAGTWKYDGESVYGYVIIEVVGNNIRGVVIHHRPGCIRSVCHTESFFQSEVADTEEIKNIRLTAVTRGLNPSSFRLRFKQNSPHMDIIMTGGGILVVPGKKIQAGICGQSIPYVSDVKRWVYD